MKKIKFSKSLCIRIIAILLVVLLAVVMFLMGQRVHIESTVKIRVKKDGSTNKAWYHICNVCHGTGVQKSGKKKK